MTEISGKQMTTRKSAVSGRGWIELTNPGVVSLVEIPRHDETGFRTGMDTLFSSGARPVAFFEISSESETESGSESGPGAGGGPRKTVYSQGPLLVAAMADDRAGTVCLLGRTFSGERKYQSLTPAHPSLHLFEREFWEETGIEPVGHPWLKPVRYPTSARGRRKALATFMEQSQRTSRTCRPHLSGGIDRSGKSDSVSALRGSAFEGYPFLSMTGLESHEVAVGPVHAGVIEPGHFRFLCFGERVYHLEIQLGYQHRAIETLIASQGTGSRMVRIAESIAGDTSVGHSWACASALEALSGTGVSERAMKIRALGLELERAAIHVGDMGALANDIAYMMGSSVFGAIRTLIINSSLSICGSRFGRGLMRVGGVNFDLTYSLAGQVDRALAQCERDIDFMARTMFDTPGVLSRFEKTGTVLTDDASRLNIVGPAGRASGLPVDIRMTHPVFPYGELLFPTRKSFTSGDVLSRGAIRYAETMESLAFCRLLLEDLGGSSSCGSSVGGMESRADVIASAGSFAGSALAADSLAISMVEGWRGEIVHCIVTGAMGKVKCCKVKDPSFNNWFGLALAVRGNGISDFPLCNKSFNLSYCGHDL